MGIENKNVAIIGSGLIGKSFALLFGTQGYKINLYDTSVPQLKKCVELIEKELENDNCKHLYTNFKIFTDLESCLQNAFFILECVYENVELKRKVFTEIDKLMQDDQILASSTSTILPSILSQDLKHKSHMLVSHPLNPPGIIPIVEIVQSPWTQNSVVETTRDIFKSLGKKPVVLKVEIPGFIVNRLQYAILNECYNLIQQDVISVKDLDEVMSDGLCLRWAFLGPLQVAHLNANGWADYAQRYGATIKSVSDTFQPPPVYEGPTVDHIDQQLKQLIPLDQLGNARDKLAGHMKDLLKLRESY